MRLAATLAVLLLWGAAPASADTMDATFGNTVTVTRPGGAMDRYYFEPDGTVRIVMMGGGEVSGRWELRGNDVCLTVNNQESCSPAPSAQTAGESWTIETPGGMVTIGIVEGR